MKIGTSLAVIALLSATSIAAPVQAQDAGASLFGVTSAAVTYGPYWRIETGVARGAPAGAYWEPPGYPTDPRVHFNLGESTGGFLSLAYGFDKMQGVRYEGALSGFGSKTYAGDWSYTVPATTGPHASMSTSLRSYSLMGNAYYAPLEARGKNSRINPFLTAGLGVAIHDMGTWTRTNPAETPTVRDFAGKTSLSLAWQVGAGVSVQLSKPGARPVILDATYRYTNLGKASGSSTPLTGASVPVTPLTIGRNEHLVSLGLRFPLGAK